MSSPNPDNGLDGGAPDLALVFHPRHFAERIDARHVVLVVVVPPVSREMLGRGGHGSVVLNARDLGAGEFRDTFRIAAEGTGLHDGIVRVEVQIDDRAKRPCTTGGAAVAGRRPPHGSDAGERFSGIVEVGRADGHGRGEVEVRCQKRAGTVFEIHADDWRPTRDRVETLPNRGDRFGIQRASEEKGTEGRHALGQPCDALRRIVRPFPDRGAKNGLDAFVEGERFGLEVHGAVTLVQGIQAPAGGSIPNFRQIDLAVNFLISACRGTA